MANCPRAYVQIQCQKLNIMLNRNIYRVYFCIVVLWNPVEDFLRIILTIQRRVKQRFTIQKENYFLRDWCWTKWNIEKRRIDRKKTWWHLYSIRSKSEAVVMSFGSAARVDKMYSSHYYKFETFTDLTNLQSCIESRDSSVGIATGYGLDDQGGREFESR
jgi:hypothetical protein